MQRDEISNEVNGSYDKDAIPDSEECVSLAGLLKKKYASYLNERFFEIKLSNDKIGVYATVTLRDAVGKFYYPVEGRVDYGMQNLDAREASLFLLDFIDSYFEEFLKNQGEVYLPIDWAEYHHQDKTLHVKGQIRNLQMEELGDAWLAGQTLN